MTTAAAALYPNTTIDSATAMAAQLEGVFGAQAKLIFCVGFCAAAFSSFITASLIGGVLLNDGLGLDGKLESPWTKVFATLVSDRSGLEKGSSPGAAGCASAEPPTIEEKV